MRVIARSLVRRGRSTNTPRLDIWSRALQALVRQRILKGVGGQHGGYLLALEAAPNHSMRHFARLTRSTAALVAISHYCAAFFHIHCITQLAFGLGHSAGPFRSGS